MFLIRVFRILSIIRAHIRNSNRLRVNFQVILLTNCKKFQHIYFYSAKIILILCKPQDVEKKSVNPVQKYFSDKLNLLVQFYENPM